MRIQYACDYDLTAISRIVNAAFEVETFLEGPRTHEEALRMMMEKGRFIIAKDPADRVVASVYTELRGERGYFGMLAVDPSQQGIGMGKVLVQAAEDHCRAHGCRHIDIDVLTLRPELFPFYRKLGYMEVRTAEFHPSRPLKPGVVCEQVLMSKQL